ncbi:MAG: hypothetical protein IJ764_07000 [Bacteroidales bacterium]|nr:hypothetical protein [Bacteroidales bacterium]
MLRKMLCAVIIVMAAFLVCACGKDDEPSLPVSDSVPSSSETSNATKARLHLETHTYHDITLKYANMQLEDLVSADTAVEVTTNLWNWQSDTLVSIEHFVGTEGSESLSYSTNFEYADGKVRIRRSDRPSQYTLMTFDSTRIISIETYIDGQRNWACDFHYDAAQDSPSSAIVNNYANGGVQNTTEYHFQFVNGDMVSLSYTSNGSSFKKNYTYGTAPNPYRFTDATLTYLNLSSHVALTEDYMYTDTYDMENVEHKDFRYTYTSEGRPLTLDIRTGSVVGKYVNEYLHHYDYVFLSD